MSLTLSRFSQEVDVASGNLDVKFFAVFKADDGRELKLPISPEASQTLIGFFADKAPPMEKEAETWEEREEQLNSLPGEEELQDATEFGSEEEQPEDDDVPDSEESVPSL